MILQILNQKRGQKNVKRGVQVGDEKVEGPLHPYIYDIKHTNIHTLAHLKHMAQIRNHLSLQKPRSTKGVLFTEMRQSPQRRAPGPFIVKLFLFFLCRQQHNPLYQRNYSTNRLMIGPTVLSYSLHFHKQPN